MEKSVFATRLVSQMKAIGLTQKELAQKVGVTEAAMSRYVNGERQPYLVTANRIAQVLGVHLQWLVGEDDVSEVYTGDNLVELVARGGASLSEEQKNKIIKVLMRGEEE